VGIQVVLNQYDLLGLREVDVAQIPQDFCVIDGRAPFGDFDMTPAFEWSKQHEEIGRAIALVFVVVARWPSRLHWLRRARLADKLL